MAHIRSNIAESFAKRMSADPKRFTVLSSDGTIDPDDISQIKIVKRAESGGAAENKTDRQKSGIDCQR